VDPVPFHFGLCAQSPHTRGSLPFGHFEISHRTIKEGRVCMLARNKKTHAMINGFDREWCSNDQKTRCSRNFGPLRLHLLFLCSNYIRDFLYNVYCNWACLALLGIQYLCNDKGRGKVVSASSTQQNVEIVSMKASSAPPCESSACFAIGAWRRQLRSTQDRGKHANAEVNQWTQVTRIQRARLWTICTLRRVASIVYSTCMR
jgi:hypothetical protein